MSLRGVRQLQKVIIQYSDIDGSSKGVREWMRKNLVQFAESSPQAEIVTIRARNAHPIIRAHYVNGNKKQIGLKNLESNTVDEHAKFLRNQIGRRMNSTGYAKPVMSTNPSIQGEWSEKMDLIGLEVKLVTK